MGRTGARYGSPAMRRRWEQEEAPAEEQPTAEPETSTSQEEDAVLGRTGSRFPSQSMLRRWEQDDAPEAPPEPEPEPVKTHFPRREELPWYRGAEAETGSDGQYAQLLRPYARTGGRTRSSYELPLERLISTSPTCTAAFLHAQPMDWQTIAGLCGHPRSVAEVAATMSVPIGVARVVISDMVDHGIVALHGTAGSSWGRPENALLQRVLDGLRRL